MELTVVFRGTMRGHTDRVTAIATKSENLIVTSSTDKSIIVWSLTKESMTSYGFPRQRLTGHSNAVRAVAISSDSKLVSAWADNDLRLWDLDTGATRHHLTGDTDGVLFVTFSPDGSLIASASNDSSIKVWDTTTGECQHAHTDRVSSVRPTFVYGSCDGTVKVWLWDSDSDKFINKHTLTVKDWLWDSDSNTFIKHTLTGHDMCVNAVAVSPDGSLIASDGESKVVLWDLVEGKLLYMHYVESIIHALRFSPTRYWLCIAAEDIIQIIDIEKDIIVKEMLVEEDEKENGVYCTSMNWSTDGDTLFGGYSDGMIRVWQVQDL